MKKGLKIFLIILLVVVLAVAVLLTFLFWGKAGTQNAEIAPVNMAEVADGAHSGQYSAGRWSNAVTVEVKDHKIVSVAVDRDVLFSLPEVKSGVIDRVLQKQNLDVDIVSGATATSKAYLKAIENALTGKK